MVGRVQLRVHRQCWGSYLLDTRRIIVELKMWKTGELWEWTYKRDIWNCDCRRSHQTEISFEGSGEKFKFKENHNEIWSMFQVRYRGHDRGVEVDTQNNSFRQLEPLMHQIDMTYQRVKTNHAHSKDFCRSCFHPGPCLFWRVLDYGRVPKLRLWLECFAFKKNMEEYRYICGFETRVFLQIWRREAYRHQKAGKPILSFFFHLFHHI